MMFSRHWFEFLTVSWANLKTIKLPQP